MPDYVGAVVGNANVKDRPFLGLFAHVGTTMQEEGEIAFGSLAQVTCFKQVGQQKSSCVSYAMPAFGHPITIPHKNQPAQ
jgi:hypothetical protein